MKRFLLCLLVSSSVFSIEEDVQKYLDLSVTKPLVGQMLKCAGGQEFNRLSWPSLMEMTIKGACGSSNFLYQIGVKIDLVDTIGTKELEERVDISATFVMPKSQESGLKSLVKDAVSGTSLIVDDQFTRCKITSSDDDRTWYACTSSPRMPLALFKQLLDDSAAKE